MNEYEAKWYPVIPDEKNEILQTEYRIAEGLRKLLNLDNQPERSKREDSSNQSLTNSQYEQFIKDTNEYLRCGALNTTETP